jgi:hypothetical protein
MDDRESRLRLLLYKWALKNALDYGGKAQEKPVIAKVVAEDPEPRRRCRSSCRR